MIGDKDLDNAGTLLLHPLSEPSASEIYDILVYKACASAESSLVGSPTEQQKLKIVWNVLPDTSVTPYRFIRYGDKDCV